MNDIERVRQALHQPAYDEALASRLGLNATDLRCLEAIAAEPGLTPGRLAEVSGLTSGAVTGVLDRLEKAGFVERRPDPRDRRSVGIHARPERLAELEAARTPLATGLAQLLDRHSATERAAIVRFLDGAVGLVSTESDRLRAATHGGFVAGEYVAPLGDVDRGRLVFSSGAPRLSMNLAPFGPEASARVIVESSASRLAFRGACPADSLLRASFEGPRPDVVLDRGTATIRYRRKTIAAFSSRDARIALNPAIPWTIDVEGGLTDLNGSLDGLRLDRLEIDGGANHIDLTLPRPTGAALVRVRGLASRARFRRPAGTAAAVRVAGGISHLRLDGQRFEKLAGERRFTSDGFATSADRYEIEILGGASDVRIETA